MRLFASLRTLVRYGLGMTGNRDEAAAAGQGANWLDDVFGRLKALGVGPEGFWRLSLKEWRMLTARPVQAAPLGRGEMERMQALWPDKV